MNLPFSFDIFQMGRNGIKSLISLYNLLVILSCLRKESSTATIKMEPKRDVGEWLRPFRHLEREEVKHLDQWDFPEFMKNSNNQIKAH